MDGNQKKYRGQIEINDLVALAVSNAAARRNQVLDLEETLSPLSDEQAGSVTGGQIQAVVVTVGLIAEPPIVLGFREPPNIAVA